MFYAFDSKWKKMKHELGLRWKKNSASEGRYRLKISSYSTVRSEISCALTLRYVDLVVSIEVAVEVCCCFTVFSR
jgi:hypothetical protein